MEENEILELRVALTAEDFERLSNFYLEGPGQRPSQHWPEDHGKALVLDLGRATLEVFDERQADTVDQIEVGKRVSGKIRFALQMPDLDAAVDRLLNYGAKLVSAPLETSWGERTARFEDPEGMQITLNQIPQE